MKKESNLSIWALLFAASTFVTTVWSIVSFLIYLVKDEPFNWLVFWIGIISFVLLLIFIILSIAVEQEMERKRQVKRKADSVIGKSKFQERLEEAQRKQEELRKSS